ncbi:hypothetical protein RB195_001606 [Necator americanus]|uniref:Uncharacterized protein n=1 Tax=Necator americanus TaxID=51031 RepID=A0ABR1DG03_NECAM
MENNGSCESDIQHEGRKSCIAWSLPIRYLPYHDVQIECSGSTVYSDSENRQRGYLHGSRCGAPARETWEVSTSDSAVKSCFKNPSSLLRSHYKETSRSPCLAGSEDSFGCKLEEAFWPEEEVQTEVVKEDLRTLGMDRQYNRDANFR